MAALAARPWSGWARSTGCGTSPSVHGGWARGQQEGIARIGISPHATARGRTTTSVDDAQRQPSRREIRVHTEEVAWTWVRGSAGDFGLSKEASARPTLLSTFLVVRSVDCLSMVTAVTLRR